MATDDRGGTGESAPARLTVLAPEASLSVSGRVMDQEGLALAGVMVRLAGAQSATTVTDALGNYSFANLQPNEAYSVMPSLANYDFRPEGFEYPSLAANESAHFIAYRQVSASQYTSNLWAPNGAVRAAVVKGDTLYIGGNFTHVGGEESYPATPSTPRAGLAAYDAGTGSLLDWNPVTGGYVTAFAVNGTTLFVGSSPASEGVERKHLAAINVNTGQPTGWNPGADGPVYDSRWATRPSLSRGASGASAAHITSRSRKLS